MGKMMILFVAIFMALPVFAKAPAVDVRSAISQFFPLDTLEGEWSFKSVDGKCRLNIEHWIETGVIKVELVSDKNSFGTAYSTVVRREETAALYNDHYMAYMSYYSDFRLTNRGMFVVEGVYEFSGDPNDGETVKRVYLSRELQIRVKGKNKYVTYVDSEKDITHTTACLF